MSKINYKIALVHDALVNRGGAEWVFQNFVEMFPDSTIYTTVYLEDKTYPFFKGKKIITTPLQKIVKNDNQLKTLFPVANFYMKQLKIEHCDIILSSSTFSAKYISKNNSKHVCYCYTPFRLLWSPDSYLTNGRSNFKLEFIKPFLSILRKMDYNASAKVDQFISMNKETHDRIESIYGKESIIIHPPIDVTKYGIGTGDGEYYLVVSRLEPYKKVEIVIDAFNKLNLPLKIVGKGTMEKELTKKAKSNIEFLGSVTDEELIKIYQGSRAVIFPQKEDYGLVPLEANACGVPVICYGYGGVQTTMVPWSDSGKSTGTALYFNEQTTDSLMDAVKRFDKINFNKNSLLNNAKRFDKPIFKQKIFKVLENIL